MTSIAIISCICGYLIIIPFDCVCRYHWLVLEYGISYFSLIIGISQVGTLASLAFQLRCFFKYSQAMQFDMVGTIRMQESSEVKKLELEMVKSVKKRKRIILALVITTVLLILTIFVFHVYYWHYRFNKEDLCTY